MLSQTDTDAAGNVIAQFGFSYDASGDITDETGIDAGITSLERLLSLPDMTYGPGNRLATYNGETVQFDADGNMTHGPLNGAMVSFSYDSKRRLTQAGSTQYVYDAENHRIGVNGTRFVVNSQPALSQVLVKTAADGARTFYVYGLGLIGEESAAGYKAYHFDFRGSTVALSDESGAVLEEFRYSAYGVLLAGDASVTPFLFNGQYGVMTDGNGLYHMRARFYSAEIRRFLNRDVLVGSVAEGQSLNRYAYVGSNPISYIDPLGYARHGGQTGQWWEFTDRNFQRWFHQCWKERGDPDATRAELAEAYAQWLQYGKPDGKNGCGGPPPTPASEEICDDVLTEDQEFMKRMSEITGLTGTALLIYLIISEGSRVLFPPRNLVPMP